METIGEGHKHKNVIMVDSMIALQVLSFVSMRE